MCKIYFITSILVFAVFTGQISAKSVSDNTAVTDSNNQKLVTAANDLADGDLRTSPKAVKQTITVGGAGSNPAPAIL
jgi:hypothetical protein